MIRWIFQGGYQEFQVAERVVNFLDSHREKFAERECYKDDLEALKKKFNERIKNIQELEVIDGKFTILINKITHVLRQKGILLTRGDQQDCNGGIIQAEALKICQLLNERRKTGVIFNINYSELTQARTRGGTCTAMSMDYLHHYLTRSKDISGKDKIIQFILDTSLQYKKSSIEFRTQQAAFNAIQKAPAELSVDFKKSKIDSLLQFYGHKIDDSYLPIEFDITTSNSQSMASTLQNLPNGAFIIRALKPSDNEKGEEHGHTTALIKEQDEIFFYDPNYGTTLLSYSQPGKNLFEKLGQTHRYFGVPEHGIYKII